MSNQSNAPKVQVKGKFGQVDQISLDTNRPSIQGESLWRAQNLVALSSRGIYSDALLWVLTPATVVRAISLAVQAGVPVVGGVVLICFLLTPPLLLILLAANQSPKTHGGASLYRLLLILIGLALALV